MKKNMGPAWKLTTFSKWTTFRKGPRCIIPAWMRSVKECLVLHKDHFLAEKHPPEEKSEQRFDD